MFDFAAQLRWPRFGRGRIRRRGALREARALVGWRVRRM